MCVSSLEDTDANYLEYPELLKWMTYFVLLWEGFGAIFLFSPIFTGPLRAFGALGFIAMHLGFSTSMRLVCLHCSQLTTVGSICCYWLVNVLNFVTWLVLGHLYLSSSSHKIKNGFQTLLQSNF